LIINLILKNIIIIIIDHGSNTTIRSVHRAYELQLLGLFTLKAIAFVRTKRFMKATVSYYSSRVRVILVHV